MCRGRLLNQDDDCFIMANWESMSNKEIAKNLGVCKETVSKRGIKLGLINKKGVSSGNYKSIETIEKIANYLDSADTIQELKARRKTLELELIKEQIKGREKLKLKIKTEAPNVPDRILKGKILQKNDNFVALKLDKYIECFRYTDFYTGKAVIM